MMKEKIRWEVLRTLVEHAEPCEKGEERRLIPPRVRLQVKAERDNRCEVCGRSAEPLHLHHMQPCGPSEPWNLVQLCQHCHQAVHNLLYVAGKHRSVSVMFSGGKPR